MSIYNQLKNDEQNNIPVALCTIIESSGSTPRKAGTKMLVYSNGSIYGSIGGGVFENNVITKAVDCIKSSNSGIFHFKMVKKEGMSCGGEAKVFIESVKGKAQLYIFGAGHIGSFLAQLAHALDFSITVVDERKEIIENLNKEKYSLINKNHSEVFKNINFGTNTYICVVTHNHLYDKEIVAYCSGQEYAYLGMLGSKSKIAAIKKEFTEKGIRTDKEMSSIDWPMGIAISCQTPKEIAVSILAKIVDVRASNN